MESVAGNFVITNAVFRRESVISERDQSGVRCEWEVGESVNAELVWSANTTHTPLPNPATAIMRLCDYDARVRESLALLDGVSDSNRLHGRHRDDVLLSELGGVER